MGVKCVVGSHLKKRARLVHGWAVPHINEEPIWKAVCVNDEDDLGSTVCLQERLCDGEVGGGLVKMVVDIVGVCGGRRGIEGALREHHLWECELISIMPGRLVEGWVSLTELSFPA